MVPEPGNPHDKGNAIAVYAAFPKIDGGYDWTHVGYLAKSDSERLRETLEEHDFLFPNENIIEGMIASKPGINTSIQLTGKLRSF